MANEQRFEKKTKNSAKIKKTASSAAMLWSAQKVLLIIPRNHIEKKLEVQSIGRWSFEKFIKDFELVKFRLIDDSTMKMDRKEKNKVNCLTG